MPPSAVLVTVHGTFARGAAWAKSDSTLSRAVLEWFAGRLGSATVMPFQWSGRNSIAARREAGASLAECLDRIRRHHPEASLYVITHSHGGSVFSYAAKSRPEIAEAVDGFVALATPWIGLEPCGYAPALRGMLARLALRAVLVLALLATPFLVNWAVVHWVSVPPRVAMRAQTIEQPAPLPGHERPTHPRPPSLADAFGKMLVHGLLTIFYSLVAALGLGIVFFPLQRLVSRRLEDSAARFRDALERMARELSTLDEPLPPSVFLKPIGDEAALALAWTSAMAALMQGASGLLFRSLQSARDVLTRVPGVLLVAGGLLLTAAWCLGTMMLALDVFPGGITDALSGTGRPDVAILAPEIWALIVWAASLLVVFVFVLVLLVAFLAALGAGVLSATAALYLRISVEATPAGSHRLVLVDVSPPSTPGSTRVPLGRLTHSALYDSPGAIRAVIEALAVFEASGRRTR